MNSRYELAPQLKTYDNIGIEWVPHLMFTQTTNFRSEIVNTDCCGLRFNEKPNLNQSILDEKITGKKSVLIGGSTAFGVGSSSDQKTISSLLSNSPDHHFYNLGCRAFMYLACAPPYSAPQPLKVSIFDVVSSAVTVKYIVFVVGCVRRSQLCGDG